MPQLSEEQLAMLVASERERRVAPLLQWETLAGRLEREGLIRSTRPLDVGRHWGFRAAAGFLILAGGMVFGRATASRSFPVVDRWLGPYVPAATMASDTAFHSAADALAAYNRAQVDAERAMTFLSSVQSAGSESSGEGTAAPVNDEVRTTNASLIKSRLAGLDALVQAAQSALFHAPSDPVINRYFMSTVGAREATLQQLRQVVPQGVQIGKF